MADDAPNPRTTTSPTGPAGPDNTGPTGPDNPDPGAAEPVSRADVAGLTHQLRTEMAHLRRDLAFRLDAAAERLETALGRRAARLGLALITAQCLVTVLSLTVLSVIVLRLTG